MDQQQFFGVIFVFGLVNLAADLLALFSPYLATSIIGNVGPIFLQECDIFGTCRMIEHGKGTGFIIIISITIVVTFARVITAYYVKAMDLLFIVIGWALRLTVVIMISQDLNNPVSYLFGLKGSHSYFYYIATLVIDGIVFGLVAAIIYRERDRDNHTILNDESPKDEV